MRRVLRCNTVASSPIQRLKICYCRKGRSDSKSRPSFKYCPKRRYDKGRIQKRLSARSSGFVESNGSGGKSDSELIQCADDTDEPLQKMNLLAGTIFRHHRCSGVAHT